MKRGGFIGRRQRIRKRKLVAKGTITDKRLDAACRAVVFARDRGHCLRCLSTNHLQWAHCYSRRYKSIRWNPLNSMCLCAGCHLWWHHRPLDSSVWWRAKFGLAAGAALKLAMQSSGKLDRRLTLLWLQQELKKYEAA